MNREEEFTERVDNFHCGKGEPDIDGIKCTYQCFSCFQIANRNKEEKLITLTVKNVAEIGKWVEFWFEEEVNIKYDEYFQKDVDRWTRSCKHGDIYKILETSGFHYPSTEERYNFLIGMKMKWTNDGANSYPVELIIPTEQQPEQKEMTEDEKWEFLDEAVLMYNLTPTNGWTEKLAKFINSVKIIKK